MKIGQRADGKWLLLDEKEVIEEFDDRADAVAALKASTVQKPVENSCKHGNKGPRECFLIPNPNYSKGYWIEKDESILRSGFNDEKVVKGKVIQWSEPHLLNSKFGHLCSDCGEIV